MKFPSFAGSEEESRCLSFSGRSVRSTSFKGKLLVQRRHEWAVVSSGAQWGGTIGAVSYHASSGVWSGGLVVGSLPSQALPQVP